MKVELELADDQVGVVADVMLEKMRDQGLVIVAPVREIPYSVAEATVALNVTDKTVRNLVEAGKLVEVPNMGRMRITAASVHALREGRSQ